MSLRLSILLAGRPFYAENKVVMRTFEATSNGLEELSAEISPREASARLPDGAYTTLRTYGGTRVLRLAEHVRRLEESARLQGLQGACRSEGVRAAVAAAILGDGPSGVAIPRDLGAAPAVRLRRAFAPLPEPLYRKGVCCVTVPVRRDNPQAKDTRFLGHGGHRLRRAPGRRARRADGRGRRRDPGGPVQQLLRRPRGRAPHGGGARARRASRARWCWRSRRTCCRARRARCGWTSWPRVRGVLHHQRLARRAAGREDRRGPRSEPARRAR